MTCWIAHAARSSGLSGSAAVSILKDRVAFISGGTGAVGEAIVRIFAREGARVAYSYREKADKARALDAELSGAGAEVRSYALDVLDGAGAIDLAERIEKEFGPVDILVNNAAAAFYLPTPEISLKRRRVMYELNVHAPIDLAQGVIPGMRAKGAGWIVNVSSVTSRHPAGPPFPAGQSVGATAATYGSSKAALERYTTGLASELYADGIAVNSVAPVAAVRTPGADALVADLMARNPALVEPMEVMVEAILALCTTDPAVLTGRIVLSGPLLAELGITPRNLDGSPIP